MAATSCATVARRPAWSIGLAPCCRCWRSVRCSSRRCDSGAGPAARGDADDGGGEHAGQAGPDRRGHVRRPRPSRQPPQPRRWSRPRRPRSAHGSRRPSRRRSRRTAVPPDSRSRRRSPPNQRLAQVRDTFEAGNYASALATLDELRASPTRRLAGLDDAEYDIRMAFAQALLAAGQPGRRLRAVRRRRSRSARATPPRRPARTRSSWRRTTRSWKRPGARTTTRAIKALEENMLLDPGFRETRPKLYALLIMKADRLLEAGEREAAFEVLDARAWRSSRTAARRSGGWRATRQPRCRPPTPAPVYRPPPAAAPATEPSTGRRSRHSTSQPAQPATIRSRRRNPPPQPTRGRAPAATNRLELPGGRLPVDYEIRR